VQLHRNTPDDQNLGGIQRLLIPRRLDIQYSGTEMRQTCHKLAASGHVHPLNYDIRTTNDVTGFIVDERGETVREELWAGCP